MKLQTLVIISLLGIVSTIAGAQTANFDNSPYNMEKSPYNASATNWAYDNRGNRVGY